MVGDDRIRLFLALRLPDEALDALAAWQVGLRGRLVARESLHVTLAFLGHRPRTELDAVVRELRAGAAAAAPILLEPRRYRETRSAAMLVLRDDESHAAALAHDLHDRLSRLGIYEPEAREWLPHLTVARFRQRPRRQPGLPRLGRFAPSDAAAFLSRLSPSGARYELHESVALGG